MLAFSPLGNNIGGNEISLSLHKNNFGDEEMVCCAAVDDPTV